MGGKGDGGKHDSGIAGRMTLLAVDEAGCRRWSTRLSSFTPCPLGALRVHPSVWPVPDVDSTLSYGQVVQTGPGTVPQYKRYSDEMPITFSFSIT
jgi:hypothetical protein